MKHYHIIYGTLFTVITLRISGHNATVGGFAIGWKIKDHLDYHGLHRLFCTYNS